MISNYLKIIVRNLFKSPVFSTINVTGLALGLSCGIFILLWVTDELKFDAFHANGPRLYRVMQTLSFGEGQLETQHSQPGLLAQALKDEVPEVEMATMMTWSIDVLATVGVESQKEPTRYVDPDFLRMFSYPLVKGNPATALTDPGSIVISEKTATRFFGADNPIGKTIRLNNATDHAVTGVFKDLPRNSSVQFEMLLPYEQWLKDNEWAKAWENNGPRTWVMLRPGADKEAVDKKIRQLITRHVPPAQQSVEATLFLQPYTEMYLYSSFKNGVQDGGRIDYIQTFSIVAIVVLAIACINFMNMATAQSLRRAKEIGIRKVNGAARRVLIAQFIGEAFVFVTIGMFFALLIVELLLPAFRELTGKDIFLPYTDPSFVGILLSIIFVTGLLSGSYPAFFLSSFNIVKVLKGKFSHPGKTVSLRKVLVVVQFCFTITLIFATIVVYKQMNYIRMKNLGFDRENLIIIQMEGELQGKHETLTSETLKLPGIRSATVSTSSPLQGSNSTIAVSWPGKLETDRVMFTQMAVGYDYLETMKIKLIDGRDFSRDFASDSVGYIINEESARRMNLTDPVGQEITFWGRTGKIVGLVKDYHLNSLHTSIEPLVLHLHPEWSHLMIARTEPGRTVEAMDGLSQLWSRMNPAYPFAYEFVDDVFESQYKSEEIVSTLANYFSGMAIFISSLGLLGLIIYTAEQRVKEFGIRKVLGASVRSIFLLLSKDFVILIVIAFAISGPFAWYVMQRWLENFAYPADISWEVFALSGFFAIAIALITVTSQAIKVAVRNPVDTLRNDC